MCGLLLHLLLDRIANLLHKFLLANRFAVASDEVIKRGKEAEQQTANNSKERIPSTLLGHVEREHRHRKIYYNAFHVRTGRATDISVSLPRDYSYTVLRERILPHRHRMKPPHLPIRSLPYPLLILPFLIRDNLLRNSGQFCFVRYRKNLHQLVLPALCERKFSVTESCFVLLLQRW